MGSAQEAGDVSPPSYASGPIQPTRPGVGTTTYTNLTPISPSDSNLLTSGSPPPQYLAPPLIPLDTQPTPGGGNAISSPPLFQPQNFGNANTGLQPLQQQQSIVPPTTTFTPLLGNANNVLLPQQQQQPQVQQVPVPVQQQQPTNTIPSPNAPPPTFQPQNHGSIGNIHQLQAQQLQAAQQAGWNGAQPNFNPNYNPAIGGIAQPVFQAVSPLHILGPGPGAVQCPNCGVRGITSITHETGSTTHLWAVVACAFICLPCIPYLVNETKDVRHTCASCGVALATYKRSGGTIVHAFGRLQ